MNLRTMRKRFGAEALGTFFVVFSPVALAGTSGLADGARGLLAASAVSGLAVMAMIYALGPVSAAHFNPAVTLAFAVTRRFPWRYVVPYWISQVIGAIVAAAVAAALFGPGHGAHVPSAPLLVGRNLGVEVAISFLLMLVISALATDSRISSTAPAIGIGFAVVIGVLVGGPVTGGSMNPARSLGPALFAGGAALTNYWLYAVGPCLGASLGALAYESLRLEPKHAKGAPNELLDTLTQIAREQ